jgi:hypothetical protein
MPIRPQLRQFYGRQWRTETRPRILARAQNKCEQCQAPNRQTVVRNHRDYPGWWFEFEGGTAHDNTGATQGAIRLSEAPGMELVESGPGARLTEIVLTVAHLNQTAGDDRDENLKALCQWCHLHHDRAQHTHNSRETRLTRKDASRPLLQEMIA